MPESHLRIIAGEFRSRRLRGPREAKGSRPYLDRVKESVFNMLRERCDDAIVLDLYAGVGTMGLEAISRGAQHAVLVENDRRTCAILEENVAMLGCADRVTTVQGDALGASCLLRAPGPVDLVFVDPPYEAMRDEPTRQRIIRQISGCASIMAGDGMVVLRSPLGPEEADQSVEGFAGPESRQYRPDMWIHLYQPETATVARDAE